jgi:hypothetical protein
VICKTLPLVLVAFLWNVLPAQALPPDAARLIQEAGNAEDDHRRQALLEQLAALPDLDASLRQEATTLAEFVRKWNESGLKFYSSQYRGKAPRDIGKYDFGVTASSPLFPLTALYRGRILAWNLIENSNIRTSRELAPWFKDEAVKSFQFTAETYPQNRIAGMYLGRPIPWPKEYPSVAGAPEWAVLEREQLDRLREIIVWWIDHRQTREGYFGGGWGDDCEMWRWWSSVLLGFDDPKINAAQLKFSRAALARPHLKGGFNTEITDVEHAAEDTTDNLIPLMVLEPDEARWQRWALRMTDFMKSAWTGRNDRGQLQFKSFYFSDQAVSPSPGRAFDVIANVAALHPTFLAWQQSGDPQLTPLLTSWLDTWVDATARAENGKPAGILPASIRWPDGQAAGAEGNWWEPVKPGGYMHSYYIWPSVITEMTDALVVAYVITKDEKYLAPIRSMADIRLRALQHPSTTPPKTGSEAWCGAQLGPRENANSNIGALVKTVARLKALTGTHEFDELLALESSEFVLRADAAGRRELEQALRESAAALRVNFAGFTSEVRSTDRVMRFAQFLSHDYQFDDYKGVSIPKHELLYRMVTGDKNAPRFPQMAVRWRTSPQDIAALVTEANGSRLEAELFHFGAEPRSMGAELRSLSPGNYRIQLRSDGAAIVPEIPSLKVERGRIPLVKFTLPPHKLCRLAIVAEDAK